MPVSTVADSILGALGSMAGASDRRAQEGLVAAQAKQVSIANEANQRILDKDAAQQLYSQIDNLGFGKYVTDADGKTGRHEVDLVGLTNANPELAAQFLGGKGANDWINHIDPKTGKKTNYTISRFVEVPAGMGADGAPAAPPVAAGLGSLPVSPTDQRSLALSSAPGPISLTPGSMAQFPQMGQTPAVPAADPTAAAPAAEKRYMLMLKKEDGTEVPATELGTSDPNDRMIIKTESELRDKSRMATTRIEALGGMHNDVTRRHLQEDLSAVVEANLRQQILDKGSQTLDFNAEAKRSFMDGVDAATGDELLERARMVGLDPAKIEEDAKTAWSANQKKALASVPKHTEDATTFHDGKALLERIVSQNEKALADYDAKNAGTSERSTTQWGTDYTNNIDPAGVYTATYNPPALGKTSGPKVDPKDSPDRKKLVAARDEAAARLKALKPPKSVQAMPDGVKAPSFEFTDENLRQSIKGKLEQPTPEQTQAIAEYGRANGIQNAADLATVPPLKAKALIWAIVSSSDGTDAEKMELFDKLNSYAQTGDPDKSAIDANLGAAEIAVRQSAVAADIGNNIRSTNASIFGAQSTAATAAQARDDKLRVEAYGRLKDVDEARRVIIKPLVDTITKGTVGENSIFLPKATPEAKEALRQLSVIVNQEHMTPASLAAGPEFAQSFLKVLVAQAGEPGAVDWKWDWAKGFAEMFLRTDPELTMSDLAASWKVKDWENGKPKNYMLAEPFRDGGNKPTRVVGALELGRLVGVDAMNTMNTIIYSQRAKDELKANGEDASPEAVDKRRRELYEADSKSHK